MNFVTIPTQICCDGEEDMHIFLQPLMHEVIYISVTNVKLENTVNLFIENIRGEIKKDDIGALVFTLVSSGLQRCVTAFPVQC